MRFLLESTSTKECLAVPIQIETGMRLRSVVSSTEVIVVRAPSDVVELTCGSVAMVHIGKPAPSVDADADLEGQSLLGKRYLDELCGIELLCTRGGQGVLACDGRMRTVQKTKPLPSSD
jgi:hypothetical protein